MEIGLLVKYNAIKHDNYQGVSGVPYDAELVIGLNESVCLGEVLGIAQKAVKNLEQDMFVGEARVKQVIVIEIL